jgi:hypothetical protein
MSLDNLANFLPRSLEVLSLNGFYLRTLAFRAPNLWCIEAKDCRFSDECFTTTQPLLELSVLTIGSLNNEPVSGLAEWLLSLPDIAHVNISPFTLTQKEIQDIEADGIALTLL